MSIEKSSKMFGVAKSMGMSELELKLRVQQSYADYVEQGLPKGIDYLKLLEELTRIQPELSEKSVLEGYARLMALGTSHVATLTTAFDVLKNLRRETRVPIPETLVRGAYLSHMVQKTYLLTDAIKELHEISGVPPSVPEKAMQATYAWLLKSKSYIGGYNIHMAKELRKLTGISPQLDETLIQEAYHIAATSRYRNRLSPDVCAIDYLKDMTGIKPCIPEKVVNQALRHLVARVDCMGIAKKLSELTGVELKINKADVQREYRHLVEIGWIRDGLKTLQEDTGIELKLDEEFVQRMYAAYVETGQARSLKELQEVTGIAPKLNKADVQRLYNSYILSEPKWGVHARATDIKELQEILGVEAKFPEHVVQKMFRFYLIKGYQFGLEDFEALREITGITPLENVVQDAYRSHIRNGQLYDVEMVEKATGVAPKFSETDVNAAYRALVKKAEQTMCYHNPAASNVAGLYDLTGVKPSNRVIQRAYSDAMSQGELNFSSIKYLWEKTGVKPSFAAVQAAYLNYVRYGRAKDFMELHNVTGVEPSKAVYEAVLRQLPQLKHR